MIRRPPRSTLDRSSAASDVYKRQVDGFVLRQVRAKEFVAHSAEMFGGSLIVAIMLGGMVAVSAFLPMRLHPMFFTLSLLAMLFALSRAIANYHVIR